MNLETQTHPLYKKLIAKPFFYLTVLCSTFAANILYAQENILQGASDFEPDSVFIEKLHKNSAIEEIACNFTEVKHISLLSNDAISEGRFRYCRGNIELAYTRPQGNLIKIENGNFTIINNGRKQSVSMNANPLMKQLAGLLEASMSGNIEMFGKESDIKYFRRGNEYIVSITPSQKRTNRYLQNIILIFDDSDMTLNRLYMFENMEDYTCYTFTGKKIAKK